jgi:glycyl-tRNA synthetase beta subunit
VKKILHSQKPSLLPKRSLPPTTSALQQRFAEVEPALLHTEAERTLFQELLDIQKMLSHAPDHIDQEADCRETLVRLSKLATPLQTLFEEVKILDEDETLKANRLALLQMAWDLCEGPLDFSKIQEHTSEIPA